MYLKKEVKFGESTLSLETGKMAKQADGSVVLRYGDTVLLVTAVSREGQEGRRLPAAHRRVPGAPVLRGTHPRQLLPPRGPPHREGDADLAASSTARCRPLFPEGYAYETQVIATVISFDPENEGDVLGITGASAALTLSNIPFDGPIAGVRVGRMDGKLIANPTATERAVSRPRRHHRLRRKPS